VCSGRGFHWRLADGSDLEILNLIDDHPRLLLVAASSSHFSDPMGTIGSPCWLAGPRHLLFKRPISCAARP